MYKLLDIVVSRKREREREEMKLRERVRDVCRETLSCENVDYNPSISRLPRDGFRAASRKCTKRLSNPTFFYIF